MVRPEDCHDPKKKSAFSWQTPELFLANDVARDLRWAHEPHMAPIVDVCAAPDGHRANPKNARSKGDLRERLN